MQEKNNGLDICPLTVLSLFSGAGGLELGARIVGGFRTVAYVEKDPYAQAVLQTNIRRGWLDDAPIWDDVTTFDGKPWRGLVDVVAGGFPCTDVSVAGKRAGIEKGQHSGLWREYARILGEVRPRFVLVENVPGLLLRGGLGVVLGDLAALGYDAQWCVRSAASVGAPQRRDRVWVVAHANRLGYGGGHSVESWTRKRDRLKAKNKGKNWNGIGLSLGIAVKLWPTPRAEKRGGVSSPGFRPTLEQEVNLWPTPTARDGKGTDATGRRGGVSLPESVRQWPTPKATDGNKPSGGGDNACP